MLQLSNLFSFTLFEERFPNSIGYVYALICHLLIVIQADNIKRTSKSLNTFQILAGMAIQLAVFNYASLKRRNLPICYNNTRTNRLLFLRAGIGPIGTCTGTLSFVLLPLSEAIAIQMTTPAITAILAIIILKENFDWTIFINSIASFIGVLLIAKPSFLFGTGLDNLAYPYRNFGIIVGLTGTFIGSIIQILLKKLGPVSNPYTITMHLGISLTAASSVVQIFVGINDWRAIDLFLMLITGTLSSMAFLLMNKSYSFGEAGKIAIMFYSRVLFAYIIDILIHSNHPDFYSILGSASIFSSVFIMMYKLR